MSRPDACRAVLDGLLHAWLTDWTLPSLLCVLLILFDTSVALFHLGGDAASGVSKLEYAKYQRNFYLTLLNIVLMVAITRSFWLLNSAKAYAERLRAAERIHAVETEQRLLEELRVQQREVHVRQLLGHVVLEHALGWATSPHTQVASVFAHWCSCQDHHHQPWDMPAI